MKNEKPNSEYKAIDFFCGGGGMSLGFKQAGIKILAGIDSSIDCKETYEYNIGAKFIHKDITKLSVNELKKLLHLKKKDDSLILIGCSPCQFWSILRTDKTKSKVSKNLLNEFRKFAENLLPGVIIVENVPGILRNKKESGLDSFIKWLETNNYIVTCEVVNMNEYGVPQNRKRLTLIASRINKKIIPSKSKVRPILKDFIGENKGFPKIIAGNKDTSNFQHTVAGLSEINIKRLKRVRKNGGNRFDFANDPELQLKCFVGKENSFRDTFARLSWDKPSSTITTKFFNISCGRFAHPEENRGLSLREGATIQTFPKNYKFISKNIGTVAKIIGNAVPPVYAKKIAEAIVSKF